MTVQKTALMTMYQNILKTEQKQANMKVKHTSYVDKLTSSSPSGRAPLGLITPRAEGDLSRLPVYAPKVSRNKTQNKTLCGCESALCGCESALCGCESKVSRRKRIESKRNELPKESLKKSQRDARW
eukprot:8742419-Pyramimonas_sp.AAC.1